MLFWPFSVKSQAKISVPKENIRFDITFEELTPVTKVLQVFPSIFEGNQAIGRKSIQGSRGAVGKPTALEGYPTSQFFLKSKLGEIETEASIEAEKSPLSRKTGLRRVSTCLKLTPERRTHLKSRFRDTLEGFPTGKTGKKLVKLVLLLNDYWQSARDTSLS